MKQQHTLQPKLRFPEFKGDWEKSNLGIISKKPKYGLNSSATEYDGINGYLRITDIDEISNKFIKDKLTSPDSFSDEFLLKERDLIFTRTGASTGKSYLYSKDDGKLYFAGFLIKFSLKDICNDKFVFYQTKLVRYSKWVKIMSMRSGQPGINSEEYSTLDIILPSLPEQQKIADYLSTIDNKINLLEEKKAQLGLYKKAMMQKLFSQEIRFKPSEAEALEAYPDWEEKRLGEVTEIKTGISNRQDSDLNSEYTFFDRSQEIRKSSRYLFDCEAIIVAGEGSEFIPKYFIGKFDLHQRTYAIMNYINALGLYLFHYINFNRKYFESQAVGSTVKSLRLPMFEKMSINLPSLPEQQKIADFLSAIDESIEKVTEQINQTQSFKKAMLQQMFV